MICYYLFFAISSNFKIVYAMVVAMLCLNIIDVAIITAIDIDYCCILCDISKSKAIHLLENSVLEDPEYI